MAVKCWSLLLGQHGQKVFLTFLSTSGKYIFQGGAMEQLTVGCTCDLLSAFIPQTQKMATFLQWKNLVVLKFYILIQNHIYIFFFYASVVMTTVKNCVKYTLRYFKTWQPSECNYPVLSGNISSITDIESCVTAQWKHLFFFFFWKGKEVNWNCEPIIWMEEEQELT